MYVKIYENMGKCPDLDYITFNLFEIYCMLSREEEIEDLVANNEQMERMFLKSTVVTRQMKIKLMRKIIKISLSLGVDPQL